MKLLESILGLIYVFCFSVCYWPQIIKSLRTKSVEDISIDLFTLSIVGYICAIGYTLIKIGNDFWLLMNYGLGLVGSISMVTVYCFYKKK